MSEVKKHLLEQQTLLRQAVDAWANRDQIKQQVLGERPYRNRVSMGFIDALLQVEKRYGDYNCVLREIDFLEGIGTRSHTKPPNQFRHAPLHPLRKKHFWTPSAHTLPNVLLHWGINIYNPNGNAKPSRAFTALFEELAEKHGEGSQSFIRAISNAMAKGGWEDRLSSDQATGDWIIFGVYGCENYYLDISPHSQSSTHDAALYQRIKFGAAACEFPFMFE